MGDGCPLESEKDGGKPKRGGKCADEWFDDVFMIENVLKVIFLSSIFITGPILI